VGPAGVNDIKELFIRRESNAIRLHEIVRNDEQLISFRVQSINIIPRLLDI